MKQRVKGPVRRLLRSAGYELIERSRDPQADVERLVRRVGIRTIIDVGANQGQYAEHARAAGFGGDIVSFEPGRRAFERLECAAARDPRWDVRRLALGAEPGELTLHVSGNSVSSSLLEVAPRHVAAAPASTPVDHETVCVRRLDEEMAGIAGPFLLKIDTQGYELPVLEGAEGILDQVQLIQVELSLVELYEGQPTYLDVLGHLERRGYMPWMLLPGFTDQASGQLLQVDVVARHSEGS